MKEQKDTRTVGDRQHAQGCGIIATGGHVVAVTTEEAYHHNHAEDQAPWERKLWHVMFGEYQSIAVLGRAELRELWPSRPPQPPTSLLSMASFA